MARTGLFLLLLVFQVHATAAPARAQDDVSAQPCQMRVIRALMSDETVANMVRCQYADVRSLLPDFTTVDWVTNDRVPLGTIMRQSAPQDTPFARLEAGFTLAVSAGPTVEINSPSVLEGGTLNFQLRPPLRVSAPYAGEYRLALDENGRREARAGTHYASVDDSAFPGSGRIDVNTLAGGGIERLYLFVELTYPPDGPGGRTTIGRSVGSILPYPRVMLEDAVAEEGTPLRFIARIDRTGLAEQPLTYRYAFGGDALASVDYVGSPRGTVTFAPGQDAVVMEVSTLANSDSLDDRRLLLSVAAPGQERTVATGTILNTTPSSGEPLDPFGEGGTSGEYETEEGGTAGLANGSNSATDPSAGSLISRLGIEWLAVIGAIAIGLLGGFLFGRGKKAPGETEEVEEPVAEPEPEPAVPPVAPVVGWTTTTPRPPRVKGGTIPIDGPAITIDSAMEPGSPARLESLSILPEEFSDE